MRRRLLLLFILLTLGATPAAAQLQAPNRLGAFERVAVASDAASLRVTAREYAPNMLPVVQRVDALCPGLILRDHAFTDAVATVLHSGATLPAVRDEMSLRVIGNRDWGRNGKRGNANDPSHDALFYRTGASPFGGAVVDIIGSAGSPDASPAWIDQTDATIAAGTTGVWVRPSGVLPACLTGGDSPRPPAELPPSSPTPVDLGPVLAKLDAIEARLAAIEAKPQAEVGLLNEYVDDMVGNGPGEPMPNHITDLKQRLDVLRSNLEQLTAWLRSRAVLRY